MILAQAQNSIRIAPQTEGLLDRVCKARTNHLGRKLFTAHGECICASCFLRFDESRPGPAEGIAPEANTRELRASGIHFGSMNWLRTSKEWQQSQFSKGNLQEAGSQCVLRICDLNLVSGAFILATRRRAPLAHITQSLDPRFPVVLVQTGAAWHKLPHWSGLHSFKTKNAQDALQPCTYSIELALQRNAKLCSTVCTQSAGHGLRSQSDQAHPLKQDCRSNCTSGKMSREPAIRLTISGK